MTQIKPFQINVTELANDSTFQSDLTGVGFAATGHTQNADTILLQGLGSPLPTYSNIEAQSNATISAGVIEGFNITNNDDGTIDISSGSGFIRATDSNVAQLLAFDLAGSSSIAVTADIQYTVYIEYNSGTPQFVLSDTTRSDINTNITLATAFRYSGDTHVHVNDYKKCIINNPAQDTLKRLCLTEPFTQEQGVLLSETGTRNIAISAGTLWEGLIQFTTPALDTSGSPQDTFVYYYRNAGSPVGGYVAVTGQTQIDNTQYDDGTGTLATLSDYRYGVHWVYLATDGVIYVVYGRGNHVRVDALAEQPPTGLPEHFANHAFLVGKIIIKKNASTFDAVESAFIESHDYNTTVHINPSTLTRSTGLYQGGQLSFGTLSGSPGTTTKFSVTAGSGIVVDNTTDPENPTYTLVTWDAFTDVEVAGIGSADRSFISIDANGNLVQQTTQYTASEHRDHIILGNIGHANQTHIVAVVDLPHTTIDVGARLVDLGHSIGTFNVSGNVYAANGANTNLNKTAGESYRVGSNFHNDPTNPDITTDSDETVLEWNYSYKNAGSPVGGYVLTGKVTSIVFGNYDDGDGTLGTVSTNEWSVQIIKFFPGGAGTRIEYGQTVYASSAAAIAAIPDPNHEHNPAFVDGVTRCYLVLRGGGSDLSDTADAVFVEAGKFAGAGGGSVSGGAASLSALFDVTLTLGSPLSAADNELLAYDSGSGIWINQTANEAGLAKAYFVDVTTSAGSPAMTETSLPAGWTTAYNSTGNFTITHGLNDAQVGFALSVMYSGTARVINPTTINANDITFQITDTLNAAVEGNVVGKLLF